MRSGTFGTLSGGRLCHWYEIENDELCVRVSDYGATLVDLTVKSRGIHAVLGFEEVSGYETSVKYMGAMIGRVANRIRGGRFELNGTVYQLAQNDSGNTLHGGRRGLDCKIWELSEHQPDSLTLTCHSLAGEEHFPGALDVAVTYSLAGSALQIRTQARTDAPTPVSLTNHAYFSLAEGQPTLENHQIQVLADEIGLLDSQGCTLSQTLEVDGTPFDLRTYRSVTEVLACRHSQLDIAGGLDHNYVLDGTGLRRVGGLKNGRLAMNVYTDMPDMHVYTANFLSSDTGRGHYRYTPHCAVCFETQFYPDAVNDPSKISPVLNPQECYDHLTVFEFTEEENA